MSERAFKPYTGPASQLYPNIYMNKVVAAGYMSRNIQATKAGSPTFRGRLYVPGAGWFWVAGWSQNGREGKAPYLSLKLNPMSDEDAERYCAPRREGVPRPQQDPKETYDDGIPF